MSTKTARLNSALNAINNVLGTSPVTAAGGKNGYIAMYKGKKMEVYADTSFEAQKIAAEKFKAKKSYDVTVMLAEKNGKPVIHDPSILGSSAVTAGAIDLSKLVEKAASMGKPLVLTSDEAEDLLAALDVHPNFAKAVKKEFFRTLKNAVRSGGDAELNHRDLLDLTPFMPRISGSASSKVNAAIAPRDVSKFEDQSALEGVIMSVLNGPSDGDIPVSVDTSQLWAEVKSKAKNWRLGPVSQSAFAKALKGLVKSRQAIIGEANEAGYRTVTLAPTTGYKVFSQIDNKYDLLGEVPGPDLGRALKQASKLVLDPNWSGAPPKFSKWQGKIGVIRFDDSPEVVEVYPSNLAYIPQMKKGNFRTAYQMTAAAKKERKVKAALYSMLPNVREVNRVIRRGVLPQTTLVNAVSEVLTRRHMSARLVEAIKAALTEAFEEGSPTIDVVDMPATA